MMDRLLEFLGLRGRGRDEEPSERPRDYTAMSDAEFFAHVREGNADRLDRTAAEMEDISLSDVEESNDIQITEPHWPVDTRGGYSVSDLYDFLTRDERDERRESVRRYLEKF